MIYGDTDSLFVHVRGRRRPRRPGARAAARSPSELTAPARRGDRARLPRREPARAALRVSLPALPHADDARYASAARRSATPARCARPTDSIHVVVRGLEAVRRDWTPLARRVQLELLRRVFADEPYEAWLIGVTRDLAAGRLDDELVYRKRIRREPTTARDPRSRRVRDDDVRGPEPLDSRTAPHRRTTTTSRSSSRRCATWCSASSARRSSGSPARRRACSDAAGSSPQPCVDSSPRYRGVYPAARTQEEAEISAIAARRGACCIEARCARIPADVTPFPIPMTPRSVGPPRSG